MAGALTNHRAADARVRHEKIVLATQVHRMMIDILAARQELRAQQDSRTQTEDVQRNDNRVSSDSSVEDDGTNSSGGGDSEDEYSGEEPPD